MLIPSMWRFVLFRRSAVENLPLVAEVVRLRSGKPISGGIGYGKLSSAARLMICFLVLRQVPAVAENWPQWRGPSGNAVSRERNLPLAWSERNGIAWKVRVPGWGNSTPAIWKDAIFLTSQKEDLLLLSRVDRPSGKIVWTKLVSRGTTPRDGKGRGSQKFNRIHNLASPSPVTNGTQVVVHFGNGDLAAYDFDGKQLWKRNLQEDHGRYTIWWGHANSPVLYNGLVFSVCMQDSLADLRDTPAASYVVAHEMKTGRLRWYVSRMTGAKSEQGDAYTTPLLVRSAGAVQLVVMGGNQLDAYSPDTGKRIWYLPKLVGGRTVTGPVAGEGHVFVTRGMRGSMLAVKLGGQGRIPFRAVDWQVPIGTPDSCTPVVSEGLLFMVADNGVARCFDVHSGSQKWKARLKGSYKASPVAADGRIYFLNTTGLCSVVSATGRFDRLTENQIPDETIASPAISGGQIFLRGREALFCIEK